MLKWFVCEIELDHQRGGGMHSQDNKMVTYEANVYPCDATRSSVASACDHFVDQFRRIRLQTKHHLEVLSPSLERSPYQ